MKERLTEFLEKNNIMLHDDSINKLLLFVKKELILFTDEWVYNSTYEDMDPEAKEYVERYLNYENRII